MKANRSEGLLIMDALSDPNLTRRLVVTASGAALLTTVAGCQTSGDTPQTPGSATGPGSEPASAPATETPSPTPEPTPTPTPAPTTETEEAEPTGTALGPTSDVPVGGGKVFKEQEVVVTQPEEGTFKAFSAVCTHRGCIVEEIAGGTINCPCHGSQFDISDASVQGGPASEPLADAKITVADDEIFLSE
jgi:Rieske Fe-S protein